jgi:hypothetical protein
MPEINKLNILHENASESRLNYLGVIKQLATIFNDKNSYQQFMSYIEPYNLNFRGEIPTVCEQSRLEKIEHAQIICYFLESESGKQNMRINQLLEKYGYLQATVDLTIPKLDRIRSRFIEIIGVVDYLVETAPHFNEKMICIYNGRFMNNYSRFLINKFRVNEQDMQRLGF